MVVSDVEVPCCVFRGTLRGTKLLLGEFRKTPQPDPWWCMALVPVFQVDSPSRDCGLVCIDGIPSLSRRCPCVLWPLVAGCPRPGLDIFPAHSILRRNYSAAFPLHFNNNIPNLLHLSHIIIRMLLFSIFHCRLLTDLSTLPDCILVFEVLQLSLTLQSITKLIIL